MRLPENDLVTFKDRSNEILSRFPQKQRSVALPNSHYIAIHAVMAQIFHSSGVGNFFEDILHGYQDVTGEGFDVGSWAEFETIHTKPISVLTTSLHILYR